MSELTSNDLQITALAPKGQTASGQSHILQSLAAKSVFSQIVQTTSTQFALYRQKNKAIVEITIPMDEKNIARRSPAFNPVEFDGIREQAGLNSVTLTPKQCINRSGTTRIQTHLIPPELGTAQTNLVYASEADVLGSLEARL